jgi:hypothetical protein
MIAEAARKVVEQTNATNRKAEEKAKKDVELATKKAKFSKKKSGSKLEKTVKIKYDD